MLVHRRSRALLGISLVTVIAAAVGCASSVDPRAESEVASTREADGPSGVMFFDPTIGGVRVDYCLHFATDCGQAAADAFCVRQGMTMATSFALETGLGHTVILGDLGSECVNPGCGGFSSIVCE